MLYIINSHSSMLYLNEYSHNKLWQYIIILTEFSQNSQTVTMFTYNTTPPQVKK